MPPVLQDRLTDSHRAALLASVVDEGRASGAIGVEGAALPGDRQTKNLYERAGIVARLITTYKAF